MKTVKGFTIVAGKLVDTDLGYGEYTYFCRDQEELNGILDDVREENPSMRIVEAELRYDDD